MSDMQKYENQQLRQELVQFDGPMQTDAQPAGDLVMPILRRWYIIVITAVVVCGIAVPAIWFLMKPMYDTTGAIAISPIVNPILFDSDLDALPPYELYKNTQAEIIRGDNVLNRVADSLAAKNLELFKAVGDPVLALRTMVTGGAIKINPDSRTELLRITMTSGDPAQAEQIVNAFIEQYMAYVNAQQATGGSNTLDVLEAKKRSLETKIEMQRTDISKLVDEFGTGELTSRQEMMLQTVARLQEDLINVTIQRISLEARVQMLDNGISAPVSTAGQIERQTAYLNADPMIQSLTAAVRQYETQLIVDKQTLAATNPELKSRVELLETFKERLDTRRKEVIAQFEANYKAELDKSQDYALAQAKAELNQTLEHEKKLREQLDKQDADTIGLGRKQLNIDDQREQLAQTKSLYNEVCRRIEEIKMEQQRPARISVEFKASSLPAKGKRQKMAMAAGFGSLALGTMFAFLLAKADKRLKGTQDIVKRVGVRIIGTTTSAKHIDKRMITSQLMDDYQTIRANLALLNGHGGSKIIVVTSPGMADGKTTFAVNLALSFAKSGENVLLIDGDLRKPDVGETLNLPRGLRGLQDYLFGKRIEDCLFKIDTAGLHLLASDNCNSADALDLLCQPGTADRIRDAAKGYNHVIIDTPPVLAFSDALVWARMSDGVILTTFAEHTSSPDLREAIDRIDEIGVKVIGTVLNNVESAQSYHRYQYGYGYDRDSDTRKPRKSERKRKRHQRLLLAAPEFTVPVQEDDRDA
jgi:capsular exopolysaccharide synthesis family protein